MAKKYLLIVVFLVVIPVGVYLALNAVALYNLLNYKYRPELYQDKSLLEVVRDVRSGNVPDTVTSRLLRENLNESHLYYPKLGIEALIIWDVPAEKADEQMNYGVTHIAGTSKPGNPGGILISGHSSYYWWQKGNYKEIFVNLGRSEIGDKIIIRNEGWYIYMVDNIYEISGDSELEFSPTGESELSLMTCVPIGTNLKRLIIEATLISSL